MKKRYKSVMLAIFCALMFSGCDTKEEGQVIVEEAPVLNAEAEPADEQVRTEEETEQIAPEEIEEREQLEFIEGKSPIVTITEDEKVWNSDDGENILLRVTRPIINVENEGFEALQNTFAECWNGIKKENKDYYEEMVQGAREIYDACSEEEKEYFAWSYSTEWLDLERCDSSVISLRIYGGEHDKGGDYHYHHGGVTYDVNTGKELKLTDILKDAEGFYPEAVSYITEYISDDFGDEFALKYKEYVAGTFEDNRILKWYLNASGIVIIYNPDEIETDMWRGLDVTLPYEKFSAYIAEEYRSPHRELIARVSIGEDISGLLGEKENICVELIDGYNLEVNSESISESVGGFEEIADVCVVKRYNGRSFLVLTCDYMSSDYVTFVYEVTGGLIRKCEEINGASVTGKCITADQVEMNMTINMLGTHWPRMTYLLTEDGKLMQTEEIFMVESDKPITVIKELPVVIEGTETILAVGEQILVTGTDNVDTVYFKTVDGVKNGSIQYEVDEENPWVKKIDGMDEYEYFEAIPYVG